MSDRRGAELHKYERMWAHPAYRRWSPGLDCVPRAIEALGMKPGQSVIDFGAGTGRASEALAVAGLRVLAVDLAANCLDRDVAVPFVQACLWDMPFMRADWAFCCDVLEHVPPEHAASVLARVCDAGSRGAFLSIATEPDGCGALIGEPLHLTVQPAAWWAALAPAGARVRETPGNVELVVTR